jgi:uncharacterized protein HemY
MLLHRSDEEDAATKYVNEALGRGYQPSIFQLMEIIIITHHTSKIALSESIDYEENVNRGNLFDF